MSGSPIGFSRKRKAFPRREKLTEAQLAARRERASAGQRCGLCCGFISSRFAISAGWCGTRDHEAQDDGNCEEFKRRTDNADL